MYLYDVKGENCFSSAETTFTSYLKKVDLYYCSKKDSLSILTTYALETFSKKKISDRLVRQKKYQFHISSFTWLQTRHILYHLL